MAPMRPSGAEPYLRQRLARRTVLLTVDVQRAFCAEDGAFARMGHHTQPLRAVLPAIAALHRRARGAGLALVHVRSEGRRWLNWSAQVAPPAMLERVEAAGPGLCWLEPGTAEVRFAEQAQPGPGEPVITKHVYDAFNGTPLLFTLRRLGAETLLIAGLTTESCVETTARSALCHGLAPVVLSDAVASSDPALHRASLAVISEIVGIVASTAEVADAAGWP